MSDAPSAQSFTVPYRGGPSWCARLTRALAFRNTSKRSQITQADRFTLEVTGGARGSRLAGRSIAATRSGHAAAPAGGADGSGTRVPGAGGASTPSADALGGVALLAPSKLGVDADAPRCATAEQ